MLCTQKKREEVEKICIECGELKIHEAKGMCHACYRRFKHKDNKLTGANKIICIECGEFKIHEAKEMCRRCYSQFKHRHNKLNGTNRIICVECGELKIHHAKGMCKKCYERVKYDNDRLDNEKKSCVECNENRIICARGMCRACYKRIFIKPKRQEKRKLVKSKKFSKLTHKPKEISKIEMSSASENDFEIPKDVGSDEEFRDSKVGLKMELKCEPSTSKE